MEQDTKGDGFVYRLGYFIIEVFLDLLLNCKMCVTFEQNIPQLQFGHYIESSSVIGRQESLYLETVDGCWGIDVLHSYQILYLYFNFSCPQMTVENMLFHIFSLLLIYALFMLNDRF